MTIELTGSNQKFDLLDQFTLSFWFKTEEANGNIVDSGRFKVFLNDGSIQAQIFTSSRWRITSPPFSHQETGLM